MRARWLSFLTLIVLLIALLRPSGADPLPPDTSQVITAAAGYLLLPQGADRTDDYIGKIAGTDALAMMQEHPGWNTFAVTRKLEFAARAAELGQQGGGQQFLARLAAALAKEYDTVYGNRDLQKLHVSTPVAKDPLVFVSPATATVEFPKGSPERAAIHALRSYMTPGYINVDWAVQKIVSDLDVAHEILITSKDIDTALTRAILHVDEHLRMDRLSDLVAGIASHFAPAAKEPAFHPYLRTGAARYEKLQERRNSVGKKPGFKPWIESDRATGTGGIVLGEEVKSAPGTRLPIVLTSIGTDNIIVRDGAGRLYLRHIDHDMFCASVRLSSQAEAGLVSIDDNGAVTIHPDLYRTSIGVTLVAADNATHQIEATTFRDDHISDSDYRSIVRMFSDARKNGIERWVWIDRELQVRLHNGVVDVVPHDGSSHISLLAMKDDDGSNHTASCVDGCAIQRDFLRNARAIFAAMPVLRQLDDFAATYAFVRWLRVHGAELPDSQECTVTAANTPDIVPRGIEGQRSSFGR